MRYLSIILVLLTACYKVEPKIDIEKPPLNLKVPTKLNLNKFKFNLITNENFSSISMKMLYIIV